MSLRRRSPTFRSPSLNEARVGFGEKVVAKMWQNSRISSIHFLPAAKDIMPKTISRRCNSVSFASFSASLTSRRRAAL